MKKDIKFIIADGNEEFRKSVAERLFAYGYEQIAEAADGEKAIEMIDMIHPDIVLIDSWIDKVDCSLLIRIVNNTDFGVDAHPYFFCLFSGEQSAAAFKYRAERKNGLYD